MCGRFVAATDPDGLVQFFVVDERQDEDLPPRWNVAPTDPVAAVVEHQGKRHLATFRWGLIPHYAKDASVAARHINARAESVASKPAFTNALARRRCIIPADAFYEWHDKVPHAITRTDGAPLAFAGLWSRWQDRTTCAIVTTAATGPVAALHDRVPVVLEPRDFAAWLDRDNQDPAAALVMLQPPGDDVLRFHRVGLAVGNVRNDGPQLLLPVEE